MKTAVLFLSHLAEDYCLQRYEKLVKKSSEKYDVFWAYHADGGKGIARLQERGIIVFSFVHLSLLLLFVLLALSCRNTADDRRMEQIISEADSLNRNYIPMTSDSLLLEACRYYDRYGTPNEQMQAHYLLGCVYRDRGEAPRAIDCYMNAIGKADTTAENCDFHRLGCVYSQMGDVYHSQYLLLNENEVRKKAQYYAEIAGDTLYSIYDSFFMASSYLLQNKTDSCEILLKKAIAQFRAFGYTQDALQASEGLMCLYAENMERLDRTAELKKLIDDYEANSDFFDRHHELIPWKRQFYYYKGRYYEFTGIIDSAEYYYRKILHPQISVAKKVPVYKGLLSVFQKKNKADSIAKYAELYCAANDTSVRTRDQEITARMAASFKYNNILHIAMIKERDANRVRFLLFVVVASVAVIFIIVVILWHRNRLRHRRKIELLKAEYANILERYNQNVQSIQLLENTHKTAIDELSQELTLVQQENADYKSRTDKSQFAISEQSVKYDAERAELLEENESLKRKMRELQNHKEIVTSIEHSKDFARETIVKRIFDLKNTPQIPISPKEKELLLSVVAQYYPIFMYEIKQKRAFSPLSIYVCILIAMNLRSGDIANMLDISYQQVSNIKQQINRDLFCDASARSLYKNLVQRYNICLS